MKRFALAVLFLLLAVLTPHARAAEAPEWFRVFSEPVTARMLLGKEVHDRGGEYLGTVGGLQFDLEHNRVRHVILDLQDRRAPYPMHALKLRGEHPYIVLDMPQDATTQAWDDMRLVPAYELLGARFTTRDGALQGTVRDVVIDAFWGSAAFAVLQTAEGLRPAPLDALWRAGNAFTLRIAAGALREVAPFTEADLRAHLRDTDFLKRNAAAAHRLTPLP